MKPRAPNITNNRKKRASTKNNKNVAPPKVGLCLHFETKCAQGFRGREIPKKTQMHKTARLLHFCCQRSLTTWLEKNLERTIRAPIGLQYPIELQ